MPKHSALKISNHEKILKNSLYRKVGDKIIPISTTLGACETSLHHIFNVLRFTIKNLRYNLRVLIMLSSRFVLYIS